MVPVVAAQAFLLLLDEQPLREERVRARLQSIRTETAEKLLPNAEAWGAPTDLAALTACLTIVSIAVNDDPRYADEAHVMMSDGDAFAGHWIEVFLDEDAVVMDASLAG